MDSRGDHGHLTTDDPHHLRKYLVRAAKAYLCALCWFGIVAVLLLYGPPAMSVASASSHATGAVAVIVGFGLCAGVATILTIVLAAGVLSLSGRIRTQKPDEQDGTTASDSMEDETHA